MFTPYVLWLVRTASYQSGDSYYFLSSSNIYVYNIFMFILMLSSILLKHNIKFCLLIFLKFFNININIRYKRIFSIFDIYFIYYQRRINLETATMILFLFIFVLICKFIYKLTYYLSLYLYLIIYLYLFIYLFTYVSF